MSTPTRTRPTTTAPAVITSPAEGALSRTELIAEADAAFAAYWDAMTARESIRLAHEVATTRVVSAWAAYTAAVAAEREALADTSPAREV